MASKSEQVLDALLAALAAAAPAGVAVARNPIVPDRLPAAGALALRDGNPGEPDVVMSPLIYSYQHRAEVEAIAPGRDAATRDAIFDGLKATVAAAIAADRTLGGLCDYIEAQAPQPEDVPVDGGDPWKAAVIPVVLHYDTDTPLT